MDFFMVGLGGMLGAISRYLMEQVVLETASGFPWTTLTVNLIGCFLFSFISFASAQWWKIRDNIRLAITTGFLGSFTTFSTFSLEVTQLIHRGSYWLALVYILLSLWGGLMLAALGMIAANKTREKLGSD